jgi:signal transduction histidine kinase/tetratricopeptide (TPR) repeat protein
MQKLLLSLLMLLLCTSLSKAQPNHKLDSLLNLVQTSKRDSNVVKLYLDIGEQYETSNPETAKAYYRKSGAISEQIGYTTGYCKYAAYYTSVLNMQGQYDSSIVINQKSLEVAQASKNQLWIAKNLFNIGNCYNYKQQYQTALEYYQKALPYFEAINNKVYLAQASDVLQMLYQNMQQYNKAIVYGEKAVSLYAGQPNSNIRGYALMNLSINYINVNPPQPGKAMEGYNEALRIARANKNLYFESAVLVNLADFHYRAGQIEKAKEKYSEALALENQTGNEEGTCISLRGLAMCELFMKNFDSSAKLLEKALAIAQKNDFLKLKEQCYTALYELSLARNDFRQYQKFVHQSDSVKLLLLNDEVLRTTQELETKYETQQKQADIQLLQKDKKLRNVYISALAIALLLVAATGALFLNNQKRKRLLAEKDAELKAQRIGELEKEKQLTATQSLLEGENAERKRLARDLHDGLGGMLSVVKLNLVNMKGNAMMSESDVSVFHKALEMLDGSIRELRRVAHNLMPESLMRYGLKPALSDFCGSVSHVNLHFFGEERRLEEKFEVTVFRIVQELVNNAIKHANAAQINVQVIIESDRLNLVVQDNGKGFDVAQTDTSQTTGLSSIRSRVESLGGHIDLISAPGKGTEVQIDLKI